MLQQENQAQSANFEWVCQALSATGEPCDTSATYRGGVCGKWFCAFHAEEEAWHRCALGPGEEGGEGTLIRPPLRSSPSLRDFSISLSSLFSGAVARNLLRWLPSTWPHLARFTISSSRHTLAATPRVR
jgi:hypothetical protein